MTFSGIIRYYLGNNGENWLQNVINFLLILDVVFLENYMSLLVEITFTFHVTCVYIEIFYPRKLEDEVFAWKSLSHD